MLFITLFSEIFALLLVLLLIFRQFFANRIARVLKISGATQALVLDNIKVLLESSILQIVLKHKSSYKCAINTGIPQNFLSDSFCFE